MWAVTLLTSKAKGSSEIRGIQVLEMKLSLAGGLLGGKHWTMVSANMAWSFTIPASLASSLDSDFTSIDGRLSLFL